MIREEHRSMMTNCIRHDPSQSTSQFHQKCSSSPTCSLSIHRLSRSNEIEIFRQHLANRFQEFRESKIFQVKEFEVKKPFWTRRVLLYWLSEFPSPPPFASSWASGPCAYLSLNQWNFSSGLIENRRKSFRLFNFEEKFANSRKENKMKKNVFLCEKSTRFGVWARTTSGAVFQSLIWLSSPFRKLKNHWKTWKLSRCFGWNRCNPLSNFRCLSASRYIDMFCNWTQHPTEFSQLSLLIISSTEIETEKKFPSCQCQWEAEIPANSRNIVRFNDTKTEINNRTDLTPSRAVRAFTN